MGNKSHKALRKALTEIADTFHRRCLAEVRPWNEAERQRFAAGFVSFASGKTGLPERTIRHHLRRHPLMQPTQVRLEPEAKPVDPSLAEYDRLHREFMANLFSRTGISTVPASSYAETDTPPEPG